MPRDELSFLIRNSGAIKADRDSMKEQGRLRDEKYQLPEAVRTHAARLDRALADVTICDPAIGSGAFPVGMLTEIVRARAVLQMANGVREPELYNLKRHAIQHSLYGVDLDAAAVDIAKLRLWLSLVVDEEDFRTIKPLPNLSYKIAHGNSVTGSVTYGDLFDSAKRERVRELKAAYFEATDQQGKEALKEQIDDLLAEMMQDGRFDFGAYFSEVWTGENDGFDIVIGNPPYVSHDAITVPKSKLKTYQVYEPFADLFCYFFEVAVRLQSSRGLVCFITSNSFLKSNYGQPLRKLLAGVNNLTHLINVEDFQIFDSAIVNSCVLIAGKQQAKLCWVVNQIYDGRTPFTLFISRNGHFAPQNEFRAEGWVLLPPELSDLKNKIESAGKTLEQRKTKIRLGIATGANYAFIIDEEIRQRLISVDSKNSQIIKPILRGRDIQRYSYQASGRYILLTRNGIDVRSQYPSVYSYLDSFGDTFKKRGAKGRHWTNLRACSFLDDFKRKLIVWIELADEGRFTVLDEEIYLVNSAYFLIPPRSLTAEYLLGVLNSNVIQWYLSVIAETSGMGTARWFNRFVKRFPVPDGDNTSISRIESIVERILKAKGQGEQVATWERELNALVYELYGLSADEIALIEAQLT